MNLLTKAKRVFEGKKILIAGLGLQGGGEGVVKFFLKAGAGLTITDLRPARDFGPLIKKLSAGIIKFVL